MTRQEVLDWLRDHPSEVHGSPEGVLDRCDLEVHEHAIEEAWTHARQLAERRERYWRDGWGANASEAFVAREVCREFAGDLRRSEPVPADGHEADYVEQDVLGALEPEARLRLLRYVHERAREEEHLAWLEVVSFTRQRGRVLSRDASFSTDLDFEKTHSYAETAARVMHILVGDYADHAHPRAR